MPPEEATSPVAEDTSAAGVAAEPTAAAHDDDASTEHLDRVEAEDENEAARKAAAASADGDDEGAAGEGAETAEGKRRDVADDGLAEVEIEGKKYRVPPELKDGIMRDADYRQKTQALAEQRKGFDTERQTWEQQREESRAALPAEHRQVAIADHAVTQARADVTEYEKIDWATWRAQTLNLPEDDPNRQQYKQFRTAYDAARESLTDAQRELGAAKDTLSAKEQARLDEQTKARDTALSEARQQTGETLKAEGWDDDRLAKVASFGVTELGYTPEELLATNDPRSWRMGYELMSLRGENATLKAQLKKTTTAETNLKAQASRPAETAKGNAQPTRPRDDNSTDTWMERRQRQIDARRKAGAR